MKREVEAAKPDLVVWQVGTNDALRHVAMEGFKSCLKNTLAWLKEQKIDVILVNPQYGDTLRGRGCDCDYRARGAGSPC